MSGAENGQMVEKNQVHYLTAGLRPLSIATSTMTLFRIVLYRQLEIISLTLQQQQQQIPTINHQLHRVLHRLQEEAKILQLIMLVAISKMIECHLSKMTVVLKKVLSIF